MRMYDDQTYAHSMNVALLCNIFAGWLRFSKEDIELATLCGLLHDIGKLVIPETIHGKTVTSVADYALLGTSHPYSVTIPNTVTSIGDYAFGYCFNNGFYSDNHDIPDNVSASRLTQKLADAGDDDTFIVCINFYSEDAQALSDTLQAEYLSECADYEYDADMKVAYATIRMAQIYSMQDI